MYRPTVLGENYIRKAIIIQIAHGKAARGIFLA